MRLKKNTYYTQTSTGQEIGTVNKRLNFSINLAVLYHFDTAQTSYSTLSQIWFRIQHHDEEKQLISHRHVILAIKVKVTWSGVGSG